MSIRTLRRLCVSALALSLATAATSSAAVIFSNLGAGDSFNGGSYWVMKVNNGVFNNAQQLASSFVPAVSEEVTSVQAAVNYYGGTSDQVYSFYLARDVSGRPGTSAEGAIVESWTSTPYNAGSSGPATLISLPSTTGTTLTAGQKYWLVMSDFTSSATTSTIRTGGWYLNNTGSAGLSGYISSSWNAYGNTSPAFRINGIVPEPATASFVAAAVMGIGRRRR